MVRLVLRRGGKAGTLTRNPEVPSGKDGYRHQTVDLFKVYLIYYFGSNPRSHVNKSSHRGRCPGMFQRITVLALSALLFSLSLASAGVSHAGTRIFTNRDGKKVEAEIIAKSDNHVRLRTPANKEYSVGLATLSQSDQEFVRNWEDPASERAVARTDLAKVMQARGFVGLPFTNERNHLFVNFTIGGKEVTFLLDSGAMGSIVTPGSAKELGLQVEASQAQVAGVGGGAKVEGQTTAKNCRFGGGSPVPMDLIVMELPATGVRIDGLIGSDFFKARQAMLDYAGGMLWLRIGSADASQSPCSASLTNSGAPGGHIGLSAADQAEDC